jgi:hypothetical protein
VTPEDTEALRYEAINRLENATKDLCLTARGAILVDAAYDRLRLARKDLEAIEDERDSLRSLVESAKGAGAALVDAYRDKCRSAEAAGWAGAPWSMLSGYYERERAARSALEVALAERDTLRRERDEARAELTKREAQDVAHMRNAEAVWQLLDVETLRAEGFEDVADAIERAARG